MLARVRRRVAPALSPPAAAQVLLDGNFLHACQLLKCAPARRAPHAPRGTDTLVCRRSLGDVREAVAKLLGATCRVFVTKCVQAELRALGADYAGAWAREAHARRAAGPAAYARSRAETARAARGLDGLSGGLEPPASAAESIAAAVGPANAEHFFVGTQDEKLRERLRKARAAARAAFAAPVAHPRHPQVTGVPILFVHSTGIGLELPTEEQRRDAVRPRPRAAMRA